MIYLKYFIFSLFFLIFSNTKSQELRFDYVEAYSETVRSSIHEKKARFANEEILLSLNYTKKEFDISYLSGAHDYLSTETLMKGTFIKKQNRIVCYSSTNKKKTYTLDIIDENRLLNRTLPHLVSDTLYISTQIKGDRQFFASWIDGKKEGTWIYFNNENAIEKKEIYKEGKLIKTIILEKNKIPPYIYRK